MIILYQKYRTLFLSRRIDSYLSSMILSFTTNIFAYYLLNTTFLGKIMNIQAPEDTEESVASSGLIIILYQKDRVVERNQFISFLMILSLATNIIAYYLLKTTVF